MLKSMGKSSGFFSGIVDNHIWSFSRIFPPFSQQGSLVGLLSCNDPVRAREVLKSIESYDLMDFETMKFVRGKCRHVDWRDGIFNKNIQSVMVGW